MKKDQILENEASRFFLVAAASLSIEHRQVAFALQCNIKSFCDHYGVENVGILKLNLKEHITDMRKADRTFRRLRALVLEKRYRGFVRVYERSACGRIDYRLLIAFDRADQRCTAQKTSEEEDFWSRTGPRYGLGGCRFEPVTSRDRAADSFGWRFIVEHGSRALKLNSELSRN